MYREMKVQLRPSPTCLNKPEDTSFFIFMCLVTALSKLEITASEGLANAEWWWEQMETDSLALVIRCRNFLSLLVRVLFMKCGWKLTINRFLPLPKALQKHPFYTLENRYFFFSAIHIQFQIESTSGEKCTGWYIRNSRALQLTI